MVAADRREFSGFPEARPIDSPLRWAAETRLDNRPCLLVANGIGRTNAAQAVQQACDSRQVGVIVSTGYAGALHPNLQTGNILVADVVHQMSPTLKYPVNQPRYQPQPGVSTGPLLTIDHIAQTASEKAQLAKTGARAVDMEASAVAAAAASREIPFYAIRSISDDANTDLGLDFNSALQPDGTIAGWQILAQAAANPRLLPRLSDLRRSAQTASANLARFLRKCEF